MKPKLLVFKRWLCDKKHRHLSYEAAARCNKTSPYPPEGFLKVEDIASMFTEAGLECSCAHIVAISKTGLVRSWRHKFNSRVFINSLDAEKLIAQGRHTYEILGVKRPRCWNEE